MPRLPAAAMTDRFDEGPGVEKVVYNDQRTASLAT